MPQEVNNANEGDLELRTGQSVRYLVQFPIGDWSGDGHSYCDYFFATSEKPLKEVREAHFRSSKVLGFNIGDLCKENQDDKLPAPAVDKLRELGYDFGKIDRLNDYDEEASREDVYPEKLFDIWLYLLNHIDPSLKLERTKIPSINFYGKDKKGRHLETPGYGVFEKG